MKEVHTMVKYIILVAFKLDLHTFEASNWKLPKKLLSWNATYHNLRSLKATRYIWPYAGVHIKSEPTK